MNNNTHTINLTPLFVVWSAIFITVAFVQNDFGWLWWAAAPWLLVLAFGLAMFLFAITLLYTKYRQGERIKVTTRKGVRYVQRGRESQWLVRR